MTRTGVVEVLSSTTEMEMKIFSSSGRAVPSHLDPIIQLYWSDTIAVIASLDKKDRGQKYEQ